MCTILKFPALFYNPFWTEKARVISKPCINRAHPILSIIFTSSKSINKILGTNFTILFVITLSLNILCSDLFLSELVSFVNHFKVEKPASDCFQLKFMDFYVQNFERSNHPNKYSPSGIFL